MAKLSAVNHKKVELNYQIGFTRKEQI